MKFVTQYTVMNLIRKRKHLSEAIIFKNVVQKAKQKQNKRQVYDNSENI